MSNHLPASSQLTFDQISLLLEIQEAAKAIRGELVPALLALNLIQTTLDELLSDESPLRPRGVLRQRGDAPASGFPFLG